MLGGSSLNWHGNISTAPMFAKLLGPKDIIVFKNRNRKWLANDRRSVLAGALQSPFVTSFEK